MRETAGLHVLTVARMMGEQQPAPTFGQPIHVSDTSPVECALDQTIVAEAEQVRVKLIATTKGQRVRECARAVPARIAERFQHETFQFPARSHIPIVPAFVSTCALVKRTSNTFSRSAGTAKASAFQSRRHREMCCVRIVLLRVQRVCQQCP